MASRSGRVSAALPTYALKSEFDKYVSTAAREFAPAGNYATKPDLDSLAATASKQYATKPDLDAFILKATSQYAPAGNYALKTDLDAFPTKLGAMTCSADGSIC